MAKSKYMTGEEFVDKQLAWMLRLHPIATWRAKKLAKKLDEVMNEYPIIQSIEFDFGRVFCYGLTSGLGMPMARTAVAVFKLWVVCNPLILENVLKLYGFDCELAHVTRYYNKTYYYIRRHREE
ncbi:MAG: hypothetical protein J6B87_00425 [Clostridia bacterium]|nr:hypothetical protein [Clostridia bacterium]